MRKIILSQHTSLDGFVAGPNGEMDWILLDDKMFDLVGTFTDEADTALYGRVTYQLMDDYWPNAAEKPNASKHDIQHSTWYNKVQKFVISKTMQGIQLKNTTIISENIPEEIKKIKEKQGSNIMIFGSPRASHLLTQHKLIDEYWIFVNPILLGEGIPLFANIKQKINLKLIATRAFPIGVTGLHYKIRD